MPAYCRLVSALSVAPLSGNGRASAWASDALGVGVAILGLIDAGQGAEILRIAGEGGFDGRGKAGLNGERLGVLVVARVGEEEAAPAVEWSWAGL